MEVDLMVDMVTIIGDRVQAMIKRA